MTNYHAIAHALSARHKEQCAQWAATCTELAARGLDFVESSCPTVHVFAATADDVRILCGRFGPPIKVDGGHVAWDAPVRVVAILEGDALKAAQVAYLKSQLDAG